MPPRRVQEVLRGWFRQWGLPRRFRVDNGSPWDSSGDLPPDLALWILGLGVEMHGNRPAHPQENGVIERSQGTAKRWAEPSACGSVATWQAERDRMDRVQRESYPVADELSRWAAWPNLSHSGRVYTPEGERRHWDHARALNHLAEYAVTRRVGKNGRISLYNRRKSVGCSHQNQTVSVSLDPEEVEWVIADAEGRQLRRLPAEELTASTSCALQVSQRPDIPRRQTRRAAKLEWPD